MLTPLDIHNKEFKRGFRGYSEVEVDSFLDEVVRDFETLLKDNAGLREQVQALSARLDHYRQLENTLQNTLIVAQETAEEVKASARKEAELIVREAQLEADRMVRLASERVQKLNEVSDNLRRQLQLFRAKMRTMLEAQMELLEADWGLEANQGQEEDGRALSLAAELAAARPEVSAALSETGEMPVVGTPSATGPLPAVTGLADTGEVPAIGREPAPEAEGGGGGLRSGGEGARPPADQLVP